MRSLMMMPDATLIGIQILICSTIILSQLQTHSQEPKCTTSKLVRKRAETLTALQFSQISKQDATGRTIRKILKRTKLPVGRVKHTLIRFVVIGEPKASTRIWILLAIPLKLQKTMMLSFVVSRVSSASAQVPSSILNFTTRVTLLQLQSIRLAPLPLRVAINKLL